MLGLSDAGVAPGEGVGVVRAVALALGDGMVPVPGAAGGGTQPARAIRDVLAASAAAERTT